MEASSEYPRNHAEYEERSAAYRLGMREAQMELAADVIRVLLAEMEKHHVEVPVVTKAQAKLLLDSAARFAPTKETT